MKAPLTLLAASAMLMTCDTDARAAEKVPLARLRRTPRRVAPA